MTIRQEAYSLIDALPDESVANLVSIMLLLPKRDTIIIEDKINIKEFSKSDKQKAFQRMEELRKISAKYQLGDLDEERANAVEEKFGKLA
ncbi:MAG: hypothetical protein J6M62_00505 [Selenomonadaceae bacterium]|nr:hypothetical protein [Selenomonadaceae bacterium]MBP3723656.1 hypothetical protein [Selenomonadaceae bacterium]